MGSALQSKNSIENVLIVVPTYNEAENIGELLKQVRSAVETAHILVVDDSSPDGTGKIVSEFALRDRQVFMVTRKKKEGLAAAYLEGFRWGLKRDYDVIIEMDADFSHAPTDLPRLLKTLESHDVAIGCRYVKEGRVSGWGWLRQFISRGGNIYAKFVLRLPYQDLTGGFNAWTRKVLESIDISKIRSRGYAFQVELKYRAHKHGFRLIEVPIHFRNRTRGASKMSSSIVWEAAFKVLQMKRFSHL